MIVTKRCTQCGEERPLEDYPPAPRRRDGRGSECRPCLRLRGAGDRAKKGMKPRREVPAGFAHCPDCETDKPLSEFPSNTGSRNGRGHYCLPCHNVRGARGRQAKHGSVRSYHLKRRYGLDEAQVDAMIEAQDGLCAICRTKPAEHVDHCHLTGQVRGILCFTCNVGLGNFADSEHRMRLAVDYLRAQQSTDATALDGTDLADWDFTGGADLAGFTELWAENA